MTHTVAGKRKLGAWEKLVAYYTAPVVKFNTYTVSKGSLLDQSEFLSLKVPKEWGIQGVSPVCINITSLSLPT